MTERAHLVFPTYNAESWQKMRAAAADGEHLHEEFERFDKANRERFEVHSSAGHLVEMVPIDVDALIAWCRSERIPLDSKARHQFTMRTLQFRDSQRGHA